MHLDPLHQFKVKKLFEISIFGFDVSFTNSSLAMLVAMFLCGVFLVWAVRGASHSSKSRLYGVVEMAFAGIQKALQNSVGHELGSEHVGQNKYIFSIFLAILSMNIVGMIPHSFAPTAQFAVTLIAGFTVLIASLVVSIQKYGFKFLGSFIPHGTPKAMAPLIFILELFSFLIRPISLCVRLGANIIAGHVMLEILATLVVMAKFVAVFPFVLIVAINLMEFGIILLQAYIFALLASVYIGNAYQH